MFVICANDYPYCVLPEGTTEEEARKFAKFLQAEDWMNRGMSPRVYYHYHDVSVMTPQRGKVWTD